MPHTKRDPVALIEEIVVDCAKNHKTITYGDLTRRTGGLRSPRFWHFYLMKLSDLSKQKYNLDIAILVVSKTTGIPGNGFGKSLSQAEFLIWQTTPQDYFDQKTKEIFDYFSNISMTKRVVIEGHEEIDFLL